MFHFSLFGLFAFLLLFLSQFYALVEFRPNIFLKKNVKYKRFFLVGATCVEGTTTTMVIKRWCVLEFVSNRSTQILFRKVCGCYSQKNDVQRMVFISKQVRIFTSFFLERHPVIMNVCCITAKERLLLSNFSDIRQTTTWKQQEY